VCVCVCVCKHPETRSTCCKCCERESWDATHTHTMSVLCVCLRVCVHARVFVYAAPLDTTKAPALGSETSKLLLELKNKHGIGLFSPRKVSLFTPQRSTSFYLLLLCDLLCMQIVTTKFSLLYMRFILYMIQCICR